MTTISADVTNEMVEWADLKVKTGFYKSRSEYFRELFRKEMLAERYPQTMMSQKTLQKIWDNEEDEIWKEYL